MKRIYIGLEQALNSAQNFALPIAIAAFDGAEVAAQYFLLMATVNVVLTVFRGLVTTPIPYLEKNKAFHDYRRRTSLWTVILYAMFAVCAFLWSLVAGEKNFVPAAEYTLLGGFLFSKEALRSLFLAFGDWGFALISTLCLSLFCVVGAGLRFIGIFDSFFDYLILGSALTIVIYVLFALKNQILSMHIATAFDRISLDALVDHFAYGKYSLMNNFCQAVIILILYRELSRVGFAEVALFGALFSLVNAASPVFQALNTYLARKLVAVSDSIGDSLKILAQALMVVSTFSVIYSAAFFIAGSAIFNVFYPELTPATGTMCLVFASAFSIQGLAYPASRLLVANGRPGIVFESGVIFCAVLAIPICVGDFDIGVLSAACLITMGRLASTLYVAGRAYHFISARLALTRS